MEETPFTYVDTVEALQEMKDALNASKEFAVDLEVCGWVCVRSFVRGGVGGMFACSSEFRALEERGWGGC